MSGSDEQTKKTVLTPAASPPPLSLLVGQLDAGLAHAAHLPPVEQWNPPFCGMIPMRIARDGRWFYQGTPIERPALVQLFSKLLRKDGERYVLVTPVECVGIEVEDAPFLAVEMKIENEGSLQILSLRTNFDDWVQIGTEHPLRFETQPDGGLKPYVLVRGDLWALATRSLLVELTDYGTIEDWRSEPWFGLRSDGQFFAMAKANGLSD